jgi:hypothetical protein
MCSTTPKTKAASPAVVTPSVIKKPDPLPPIKSLQDFLTEQYNIEKTKLEPSSNHFGSNVVKDIAAAISILAIVIKGDNQYAEINGTKMHYSASLLKVACMYAAFDLRCAARQFAKDNHFTTQPDFLNNFAGAVDTSTAIQRLKDFGQGLKPDLPKIFQGFSDTGPNQVKFTQLFDSDMTAMIVDSDDPKAGNCIRKLGYSYINVSMIRGKFFDPATLNGIWLAGDYTGEAVLTSVRVPVENDWVPNGSGQATTTKEMCRMFHFIHSGKALAHVTDATDRNAAIEGMHNLVSSAGWWFSKPFTSTVKLTETLLFSRDCAKVGVGPLGKSGDNGPSVVSLGNVALWDKNEEIDNFNTKYKRKLTGEFAMCWQNMYEPFSHFDSLVRILNKSIHNFLLQ